MKPIIGISAGYSSTDSTKAICELVESMGALTYLICEHQNRDIERDLDATDAWFIMGNDLDIDPSTYADNYPEGDPKRNLHPKTKSEYVDKRGEHRAQFERDLITALLARKKPIVGICGGMQRINIVLGGTLHQHIPDMVGDDRHCQNTRGVDLKTAEIPIVIEGNTLLAEIAACVSLPCIKKQEKSEPKVIYENSVHHQSVDYIAEGLRRCCVTDAVSKKTGKTGYIVKGIEMDPDSDLADQFILGLQWHPEFRASELGVQIVRRLLDEAKKRRG